MTTISSDSAQNGRRSVWAHIRNFIVFNLALFPLQTTLRTHSTPKQPNIVTTFTSAMFIQPANICSKFVRRGNVLRNSSRSPVNLRTATLRVLTLSYFPQLLRRSCHNFSHFSFPRLWLACL
jgi:hypothetical protein